MKIVFPLTELSNALNEEVGVFRGSDQLADEAYKSAREEDGDYFNASYTFCDGVLEVSCDRDWQICAIFVDGTVSKAYSIVIPEFPMSMSRDEVRLQHGEPEKSGEKTTDDILGEFPAWDRFQMADYGCLVHLGYNDDCTAISKLTVMPSDWEPGQN